jgi:hypothetical protein
VIEATTVPENVAEKVGEGETIVGRKGVAEGKIATDDPIGVSRTLEASR